MASSCRRPLGLYPGRLHLDVSRDATPMASTCSTEGERCAGNRGAPARRIPGGSMHDRRLWGRRATCPTAPFPGARERRRGFSRGFKRRAHRGAFARRPCARYRHRVLWESTTTDGRGAANQAAGRGRALPPAAPAVRIARRRRLACPDAAESFLERLPQRCFRGCVRRIPMRRGVVLHAVPRPSWRVRAGPHVHPPSARHRCPRDTMKPSASRRRPMAARRSDLRGVRARLRGVRRHASRRARHAPDCGHGSRIDASAGAR